jgi:lipoprotein-anchoring transpeptidase ErfK/SrfK
VEAFAAVPGLRAAAEAPAPSIPRPEPTPPRARADSPAQLRVVVSLPLQRAYVFKGDDLLMTSPVSTGKRGHETPAGTFRILEKKRHHRSNRYANAPMPFMQRLTWTGIALHAGHVPGYRASHGCIRFPAKAARKLYGLTNFATEVTVTHRRPKSGVAALGLT